MVTHIYTDGSSRGNPGPGGWGAIVINNKHVAEIGGGEEMTTNNKMELMAAIEGLKHTNPQEEVVVFTDSEYLMKGITIWIKNWQQNNWRTKDKKEVLNKDLWEALLTETEKRNVSWKKVLGHSGDMLNDRCDLIATCFADKKRIELYNGPKQSYFAFHHKK